MKSVAKKLLYINLVLQVFCACSCQDENPDPYRSPETALDYALDSLYAHNYDVYIRSVALENGRHVLHEDVMSNLLKQHVQFIEEEKGEVVSCDIVRTDYQTDSLATVYYQLSFSSGATEVSSQKMMCQNGEWKLRIRN